MELLSNVDVGNDDAVRGIVWVVARQLGAVNFDCQCAITYKVNNEKTKKTDECEIRLSSLRRPKVGGGFRVQSSQETARLMFGGE